MKSNTGLNSKESSNFIDHILNKFTLDMLQNNNAAGEIFESIKQYPDHYLLNCYVASLYLYAQTDEMVLNAKNHLSVAKNQLFLASVRGKYLFEALDNWAEGHYYSAIDHFSRLLQEFPEDLLSLKYAEWLFYVIGQQFASEQFCRLCEVIVSHHKENPYFLSVYSFALELNGQREPAMTLAKKALSIKPDLVWAQHTVAHVHLMTGQIEAGIQFLQSMQKNWQNLVPTLKSHMNWHLGLLYVANREETLAMQLFKSAIWRADSSVASVLVQQDAIMFLWRMAIAGMPQADYWSIVLEKSLPNLNQFYMPFNSVNYIYLCGKNNRSDLVEQILNKANRHAQTLNAVEKKVWLNVGIPFMQAVYEFSMEQYQIAVDLMAPIIAEVFCMGGSDAEDELYQMTYCCALLKLGKLDVAKQHFNQYLPHYSDSALAAYWL